MGKSFLYKAFFDLVYAPGKVTAVSYKDGVETGRMDLITANHRIRLNLKAETELVKADGMDLAYVQINIIDEYGICNTFMDSKVRITVEGQGKLQGYGSANPTSNDNFYDTEITTFHGKALAVIRAMNEPGDIIITAESEGLESTKLVIKSI